MTLAQGQFSYISDPLGNIVTANGTFSSPILTGFSSLFVAGFTE
jgi:hypothetical protein